MIGHDFVNLSIKSLEMNNHKKRWTTSEKMEIINHYKLHGATRTSREYEVSVGSIYKWKNIYDEHGAAGFSKNKTTTTSESLENRRLRRENDALKKLVAEKELRLRIQEEMLKKSR